MTYLHEGDTSLDYLPCRYGRSRLLFRGPRRDLSGPNVVVLGGIETYGRYIPRPYPLLLEEAMGRTVVNLGCPNAGPDAWLGDPAVMDVVGQAQIVVVQLPSAADLTNRLYAVHPRRNDRFLRASPILQTIYREVDFTDFNFTRHMLRSLYQAGPDRFALVADELRAAWIGRMQLLLQRIPGQTVLLWLSDAPPGPRCDLPQTEPVLVDAEMVAAVRPFAAATVEVVPGPAARAQGTAGMVIPALAQTAAQGLPSVAAHAEVAQALAPVLRALI
jgi:Domain of unknown function (DUF6473)